MKHIIPVFAVLALLACGKKTDPNLANKINNAPINTAKMVRVLADIHLAETTLGALSLKTRDSLAPIYYTQIYRINGIAKADFDKTLQLYLDKPAAAQELYEQITTRLSQDETENKGAAVVVNPIQK
jgi:hypothetical protein